ncbi:MAG: HAMP domain-containing sensor histidine kinase [Campylobacterota bacterium]|nr:HAMP domain-containing sensor histidine kinase [Campylobacterota bacterium]
MILASGYFYYEEQKKTMIEKEHFSMIEYVRQMKMKQLPMSEHIKYEVVDIEINNFNMNNFEIKEREFIKYMPFNWEGGYILVRKDKVHYEESIFEIKIYIILIQVLLLFFFASLSYFLSYKALRPMQEAIEKLDNFSKDMIHDLNTPITSILLNMKILDANAAFKENKALSRIKRSVDDIGELHGNLTALLQEDTMKVQNENLFEIVNEVVSSHKKIYPEISFDIRDADYFAKVNRDAFKQVIVNLLSNACKYSKEKAYIKVYAKDKTLYIEDNGVGIKNPKHIFERSYKEHSSGHGIGLDIVKRLCDSMEIEIAVESKLEVGTTISLAFKF